MFFIKEILKNSLRGRDLIALLQTIMFRNNTTVKISRPGSWVILSRTNEVKARDGVEPDFDGILFLGYDKIGQEHYTLSAE